MKLGFKTFKRFIHDHSGGSQGGTIAHSDTTGQTASDHHTKYTDAEAVAAVEAASPLELAGRVNVSHPTVAIIRLKDSGAGVDEKGWALISNNGVFRIGSIDDSDVNQATVFDAASATGVATFAAIPVLPASDPTSDNQAARKAYVDSQVASVDFQRFTSSGTWSKPTGVTTVVVDIIGAGGGGVVGANDGGGGGGGARKRLVYSADDLPSSVSVTVGSGGSPGNAGGNSSVSGTGMVTQTAFGGGAGHADGGGGGGGGTGGAGSSASTGGDGGSPTMQGVSQGDSLGGRGAKGGDTTDAGSNAEWGGGGGGGGNATLGELGGSSIFAAGGGGGGGVQGGGDGGSHGSYTAGGGGLGNDTTADAIDGDDNPDGAGDGGGGSDAGIAGDGGAPGGGGGGTSVDGTAGSGARGEVRIWSW